MEQEKKFTWADLKEFVNKIDPGFLDQEVMWWGEDRGGKISGAKQLTEDYGNPSGDGVEPVSVYKDEPDFDESEFDIQEGTPVLFADDITDV